MSYSLQGHNSHPSKIIYLDSRDASTYLATNSDGFDMNSYFQYILNEQIAIPDNMNVLISLNGATIPYSFYNIREGVNDKIDFTITENGTTNVSSATLTIPAGNYSAISLGNYLEGAFPDQVFSGFGGVGGYDFTFGCDYQPDSQKYLLSVAGAGDDVGKTLFATILFDSGANQDSHARIELGFRARDVVVLAGSTALSRTSDNVIDINGSIHGVYIRTNLVSAGTLDSQNGTFSNILARIPIKVQSGGIIFSEPSNNTHKSLVDLSVIGTLTIRLTDERNRILDLNGLHFQLGIQIDFIEKVKPLQDISADERRIAEQYGVRSDTGSGKVVEQAQIIQQQEQQLIRYKERNKVGRPRKVGRPKGSTKINE
tara:strand:+ start:2594 stop:3706 length:1113 start_codon:yes stop_codon:yes gene_type:complete